MPRSSLKYYRPSAGVSAGQQALRANSTPVSVPSSLSRGVIGVTGLDNAPAVSHVQTAGQAGTSLRAAYGMNGSSTGRTDARPARVAAR